MYGSPDPRAWVAHGFTDGYMQPSLYGDNQWALCVSCGAWAALHQFESYVHGSVDRTSSGGGGSEGGGGGLLGAFSSFRGVVDGGNDVGGELLRVINTLRGVVLFFKHYMFRVEGSGGKGIDSYTMHTGPTTSPENSYILLHTGRYHSRFLLFGSFICSCVFFICVVSHNVCYLLTGEASSAQSPPAPHAPPAPPHPPTGEPYSVQSLTFSPAIDISVLRQVIRRSVFSHWRKQCELNAILIALFVHTGCQRIPPVHGASQRTERSAQTAASAQCVYHHPRWCQGEDTRI
jgi:hypothetical protein